MSAESPGWKVADPFDLPEWLGAQDLTWAADISIGGSAAPGSLRGTGDLVLPLTVLAADEAFPVPVVDEGVRSQVHQAWQYGQVALLTDAEMHAVAAPVTRVDVDLVCEALRRFAKAIGVEPGRVRVLVRL